ncbi:MAG: L-seryl-tRNA(Sec) selenium transferase [Armatimonadota bacterium]|nr:L-seryl-tRNA(Sec) selenium transferase [Armatimonadota bacterium]MDR7400720.1 L-seryl-tRNA(Sec) selenium transferase [Armatimonadota bacterium]MDR7403653.1 L-seryl-tRNA(Sec) selenium transferase [Armatimonadota bacterium]MDR7436469.1 L-seryl-tRNA(Sec) selenium transferase [Armatimonadota bacterium]MDR7472504.1 L-seryl-tRNA(Sec) selenium transferase [Armatimonadota bacterium]
MPDLRQIPSVERLVQEVERTAGGRLPRAVVVSCARDVVEDIRARARRGEPVDMSLPALAAEVQAQAARRTALTLRRAVNATGVILHTNLGRAPLPEAARAAVLEVLSGYSTLEVDPDSGGRGSRHYHVEPLLRDLTGAEAALAVNNNAAAVLLALTALAAGRHVIVSRGELVEIGGSFRMPDVMAQSGAVLVEVGTTNRTYLRDYERALTPQTALLLKVHRSNFALTGFVHDVPASDLVALGRRVGVPVMYDLGSGCLVQLRERGLPAEPTVQEAVAAGCDVVTFSGDKLLGGPQAGVIVGRARWLEAIRSHPLARAVRMDKLDYAALAATLALYRDPATVWEQVPVLRMLAQSPEALRARAERLRKAAAAVLPPGWRADVRASTSAVGGGALPGADLPSYALVVRGPLPADTLDRVLRDHEPPVYGRIEADAVLLDVRTLLPDEDDVVLDALAAAARAARTASGG